MADGKRTEETRRDAGWRHAREDQADIGTHRRSDSTDGNRSSLLYKAAPGICRDWTPNAAGMGERLQYLATWLKPLPCRSARRPRRERGPNGMRPAYDSTPAARTRNKKGGARCC